MEYFNYISVYMYMFISIFIYAIPYIFIFIIIKAFSSIRRNAIKNEFKRNNIINKKIDIKKNGNYKYEREYNDVSKEELLKFNTEDINTLKDYFYEMFVKFEKSYNDLDYNTMKLLSTKQLYQNYYTGINLDLKSGRKKIISNIEKKKVIIFELDSTIAKQVASLMIEISYLNYTIDKNGYIISGSKDKKVREKFEITFRKDFEREEITKCPTCGANITGNKCEYCRSIIKNVEFKISSIKKIIDEE